MTEGQGGSTPAGWYPDPEGNGERWWNGMSWGQLRQPPTGAPQQPQPPQAYGQQQPLGQHSDSGHQQQPQQAPQWAQQSQPHQASQAPSGQGLRCMNCQFTDFTQAEFVLTPGGGTFLDRGTGMATAQCLTCRRCGFIHWFAGR